MSLRELTLARAIALVWPNDHVGADAQTGVVPIAGVMLDRPCIVVAGVGPGAGIFQDGAGVGRAGTRFVAGALLDRPAVFGAG